MYIRVDLAPARPVVTLEDPDDCGRFHLEAVGPADPGRLFGALVDAAAGRLEGDHAWVTVDAVRRLAAGRVAPDWDERLGAMLAFARSKGWLDEPGHAVRAHVEWRAS